MPNRTRVLVVNDKQDTFDSLRAVLESHGYNAKRIYSALAPLLRTFGTSIPT
jgi:CheY-like chemotaxis protein